MSCNFGHIQADKCCEIGDFVDGIGNLIYKNLATWEPLNMLIVQISIAFADY